MRKVALPTLHGKGAQIIPAFASHHDFEIIEVALDTDQFGTFAGERERTMAPLDAAIAKAKLAVEISGWDAAIASEGSIGSDPHIPFINSDREVMVFFDAKQNLLIHESHRSLEITVARTKYQAGDDLSEFLKSADFPRHKLIVTTKNSDSFFVKKGIAHQDELLLALEEAVKVSGGSEIIIESDLRAHASPSRQRNISALAHLLAERVATKCPECNCPGWGRVDFDFGVECEECGHLDRRIPAREINGCIRCVFRHEGKVLREKISASECELCNP